ncbi:iron-containing alcohol dehydrogenase [Rhodopirellula sp. JC639]|uniref:iron-containing alcohol dehydrogenase n=1 Tax=Stieleria mannarensis TaxID=2755585 RepID=UPI001603E5A0|nr:iron-containing alcohol dehydrogenase [Rhodopirellula sp. JC639]
MHFGFHVPTKLFFGAGTFQRAGEVTASLGKRVFVVTGCSAMDRLGLSERLLDDLNQHSLSVRRCCGLELSPTTTDIDRGAAEARNYRAEVIVALGGGSVLDCAKAIAGVAASRRPAADFLYKRTEVDSKALPSVCIPTTAGTGSELNRSAIIRDPEKSLKDGIRSDYLFPRVALVDPELTWTVPKLVTAQTGFDILAHAIESYVSPKRTTSTCRQR